jgi:hypothetical protein
MKIKKTKSKKRKKFKKKGQIRNRNAHPPSLRARENHKQLAFTSTGEIFQPIRLHYEVIETEKLPIEFSKLQCMDYDHQQERWVWLYTAEADRLFKNQPNKENPIVIGEFILKGDKKIVLNLRSFERAIEALVFFDRYIPRTTARVTHITTINKLFNIEEATSITKLDKIFERSDITIRNPEVITQKLLEIAKKTDNQAKRSKAVGQFIEELSSQAQPEIEKFPTNYYEDGIDSVRCSLNTIKHVAIQHWKGNKDYTTRDAIHHMITTGKGFEDSE